MSEINEKYPPSEALKKYCVQCLGLSQHYQEQIENCTGDKAYAGPCPLYPYRLGKRVSVKVFRKYCLYCCGNDRAGVEECKTESCPLWPYRWGKNPARKGLGNIKNTFVSGSLNAQI